MAARDPEMAHALCDAADVFKVPLMGMVGTLHETVFTQRGHEFISEFYTDLDYGDQGELVITREHHAVEPTEAAARSVRALREGLTRSLGGKDVRVRADAICVHSDTPNAVAIAAAVRDAVAPYLRAA
jgi:UPF0271 protein